jgi:hypothetical protein
MRCANKLLVFLLILISFFENISAQSVTDQQQVLYLRRLQLDGKFSNEFSFQQRAFFNSSVDLPEVIQQFSFGDKLAVKGLDSNHYQLKPVFQYLFYYPFYYPFYLNIIITNFLNFLFLNF